jgi:hypothetical protein
LNLRRIAGDQLPDADGVIQQGGVPIMRKLLCVLSASAVAATLLCTNAMAWDNCGHGMHRNWSGYCVSNYGPSSGCPYGYHMGWNIHACVPNHY